VCAASIATGTGPDEHEIPAMNWYHRGEGRYIEYGTSFRASQAFGIKQSLTDTIYNMNLEHLSRDVETVFERLDDAEIRTAGTTYLMYRGRHRHEPSVDTALSRLAHTAFGLPLAIFLLYNFMSQLPRDLFESSAIDGASAFQTFIRIVLPLSIPALGAFAIFQFLWVWNDLLVALVFLGVDKSLQVMPTALYNMIGPRGGAWHLLTAGAFLTMIVPLGVFLALQRAFVRGILAGSVK
jgi:hypothetical protein